jgi:hypothetical protein
MKFLCIPCDSPMKLRAMGPPAGGSLSVVYACPECGYEMAMLTNPYETQLVQSLGVRIGPETGAGTSSAINAIAGAPVPDARLSADEGVERSGSASSARCPFAAMMPAMEGALTETGPAIPASAEAVTGSVPAGSDARAVHAGAPTPVRWTAGAEARLANIPSFVRPMARIGIERFAQERGASEVDERILDAARDFFGM